MAQFVPPGLPGAPDARPDWQSRLREAALVSPSGTRIRFDYEDVSRVIPLRGTAFDFPGVPDAYVQRTGHGSRRYPLRCFFSGPDHDLHATAFEAALLEDGVSRLEHPRYGTVNVVPFGEIARRDDLKSAGNQTVIEVTFWTTLLAIYPGASTDPQSEILAAVAAYDEAAGARFAEAVNLADAATRADVKASIRSMLRRVSAGLQAVSNSVLAVNREFRDIQALVNEGIDVLIGQPLELARQVSNLIKAPARAAAGIASRLESYAALAESIFGSPEGNPATQAVAGLTQAARAAQLANGVHVADLFAGQAVAGSVVAAIADPVADAEPGTGSAATTTVPAGATAGAVGVRPVTRATVIRAAEAILEQWEAFVEWRDASFDVLAELPQGAAKTDPLGVARIDTGDSIQALQRAVSLAAGRMIQVSFALSPERSIVLDRARTIVDVCAELYGRVDDRIDFLIATNELVGDELIELPAGRQILYYPDL